MDASYSGQWIIEQRGRIIAHARTAEAALSQLDAAGDSDDFTLRYVDDPSGEPLALASTLGDLRPHLLDLQQPVYLVGGALRDAVLGRASHDLDMLVPAEAIRLTFRLADALHLPAYVLDATRDVGRVVVAGSEASIDIARYRGSDLESDLYGRDFTINALALPATATTATGLIDRYGGLADLQARQIRIIHPDTIVEDPIRALRAVRLAAQLGFTLSTDTEAAVRAGAPLLTEMSAERIRDELVRLLDGERPSAAVRRLAELDILPIVLPEVAALDGIEQSPPHHEPVLDHTIRVLAELERVEDALDGQTEGPGMAEMAALLAPYREGLLAHLARPVDGGLTGRAMLRWAALFHDTGKATTGTVDPDGRIRFLGHDEAGARLTGFRLRKMAMSGAAAHHAGRIVDGHMRPLGLASSPQLPSRRAIYRYFLALDSAGLDVVLLSLADHLATHDGPGAPAEWRQLLAVAESLLSTYFEQKQEVVSPARYLSGSEVMALLDIPGGPEVGRILAAVEEAQAAGEVTSREQAEALARQLHDPTRKNR